MQNSPVLATDPSRRKGDASRFKSSAVLLPRPLYLFLALSAYLTIAAFLFASIMRALHFGLPYSFPYYFVPGDLDKDFSAFSTKFSFYPTFRFYSGEAGYFMYPLPLFYLLLPIFRLPHPAWVFALLLLGLTSVLVYVFVRTMKTAGMVGSTLHLFVGATVLLSYPLAFEYQRANVEIVMFSLTALGVMAWWRDKPMLAALLFGIAGACKLYPLILVGLLFSERRWRAVGFAFLTAAACLVLSAWAFGPTIHDAFAWNSFQLRLFQTHYAGIPSQLGFDHSFFGLIKAVTLPWHPNLSWLVPVYVRTAAVCALILYFARIRALPRLNQLVILSLLSVTLPPVSYDYTLLAVYAPLVLLSAETVRRAQRGLDPFSHAVRYFILFATMLTPLSFFTWLSNPHGAQVRCICILLMIWTALRYPIQEVVPSLQDTPEAAFTY